MNLLSKFLILVLIILVIVFCLCRDSFINNSDSNVYISMTTIPERLKNDWWYNNLKQNMSSLKSNYAIIINIPYYSLKGEKYIIPDKVIKLQKENPEQLILNRVKKDEGPITKLLPTLRNNKIKDSDIIIICDDDFYYKPNVFKLLEEGVNVNPKKVSLMCAYPVFLQGYRGFAFKKKILKNILNFNYPKSCIKVDDIIINHYITKINIQLNYVPYENDKNWTCSINLETDKSRPKWYELNNDNRIGHILACKNDFKKLF